MDLLNKVWRDLNNPRIWKKAPARVRDIYRDHYANYRRIFSQARPFNVDDRALEVALELSTEGPHKMAERLFMARLPFPKVWIELDFHQRVRIGNRLGIATELDDSAPEKLGWLLQEDPGDPLRWSATTWVSVGDSKPAHVPHRGEMLSSMSMVNWMIDTANRAPPEQIGSTLGVQKDLLEGVVKISDAAYDKHGEESWRSFAHLGWGYSAADTKEVGTILGGAIAAVDPMRALTIASQLKNSINAGWEPMSRQIWAGNHATDEMRQQYVMTAMEARGDVRLITTLLSLLNEVPIVETPVQQKGSFSGAGGIIKKYLTNRTVTINIPAKKPIGQVRKLLARKVKSHKARHEVRGHWRTIVHKEDHWRKVAQPDGSIERVFIAKGQLERVWVNHHERGDAAYGFVKHDYQVEKSGGNSKSGRAAKPRESHLPVDPELPAGRPD